MAFTSAMGLLTILVATAVTVSVVFATLSVVDSTLDKMCSIPGSA